MVVSVFGWLLLQNTNNEWKKMYFRDSQDKIQITNGKKVIFPNEWKKINNEWKKIYALFNYSECILITNNTYIL
jgi:hypothetical protein